VPTFRGCPVGGSISNENFSIERYGRECSEVKNPISTEDNLSVGLRKGKAIVRESAIARSRVCCINNRIDASVGVEAAPEVIRRVGRRGNSSNISWGSVSDALICSK
jgi:hypothetical protein